MSTPNQITTAAQQQHRQLSLQPQTQQQLSQTPAQYRAISRNNSNTSTASSSNKGEFSSTLSTTNSVASSRSQLSKAHQLIDHRQLLATCANSTPIRSFQRATISSVVKTRAFDNNPVLQGLLTASPSGRNSTSDSQTPSPLSTTPVFSRSRSLRMSGGPQRYQQSPSYQFKTSRTPDLNSFKSNTVNSSDMTSLHSNESQIRINELTSERSELKESLEFLEFERQALIDSASEFKQALERERSQWKKEREELKNQLTDSIAARIKAESQLTKLDVATNDSKSQFKRSQDELQANGRQLDSVKKSLEAAQREIKELVAINEELKRTLIERLKFNGLSNNTVDSSTYNPSECISIVTEMARLRLELNEKDKIIAKHCGSGAANQDDEEALGQTKLAPNSSCYELEKLNEFLDKTVECIKSWPEELAGSSHVQNLMKTLLSAYRPEQDDELSLKLRNIHL